MGDNDYNVAVNPFPGLFPPGHPAAAIPMQWTGCLVERVMVFVKS